MQYHIVEKLKSEIEDINCRLADGLLDQILQIDLDLDHRQGGAFPSFTVLKSGDLSGLTSLKNVNFFFTKLKNVPPDLFSHATSLEFIRFSVNQITQFPVGVFSGLPSLKDLVIGETHLSQQERKRLKEEVEALPQKPKLKGEIKPF